MVDNDGDEISVIIMAVVVLVAFCLQVSYISFLSYTYMYNII